MARQIKEPTMGLETYKIALPIDTYEERSVRLLHTLCNKYREENK